MRYYSIVEVIDYLVTSVIPSIKTITPNLSLS